VKRAERALLFLLPIVFVPVSIIVVMAKISDFCILFSVLHAVLTLLIGLRIAQGKMGVSALWSFVTFLSILVPSLYVVFFTTSLAMARPTIELVSGLCLMAVAVGSFPRKKDIRAFFTVLRLSFGIQLGSMVVYFLSFLVGQYVISLATLDLNYAKAFADIQVICGVQSLIYSRAFLFFEGRVLKENKTFLFAWIKLGYITVFALLTYIVVGFVFESPLGSFYSVLAWSNLGAITLGMISQYLNEKYRVEFLLVSATFAGAFHFVIVTPHLVPSSWASLVVALFSTAALSVIFMLRATLSRKTFFHHVRDD
jgi:hypothetical protein